MPPEYSRDSSPSGAQSVALGIWAVWTVLLPQVVMVAAATTEAAVQFESAQREIGRDLYLAIEDEAARRVVSLIGFQASRLDIETKANGAFESIEAEWLRRMAEARRQLNSLREPYDQRREHQGKQWRLVAAVSPGFNLHALIAETLGTGPGAADAWLAAVAAHRRQLEEHLFDDRPTVPLRLTLDTGVEAWTYPRHDPIGFADLPQFHPPDPPPPNTLPWRLAVLNLLSLGALVAVCPTRP